MHQIIILPLIAGLLAQVLKFFIRSNKLKPSFKALTTYSGMPSGHSAIVTSLAVIVGLQEGWDSSIFAVSLVFAILTIRDALGIRQYLGQHGKMLNILIKDLDDDNVLTQKYPHMLERIGHTPIQVFVGSILGLIVSLIGFITIT